MKASLTKWKTTLDDLDNRLLNALHRDARASLSELAETLGVTRTTVRSRLQRLKHLYEELVVKPRDFGF